MTDSTLKRYIIRKYVLARSLEEAIQKEPMHVVDECFVDDEWMKKNPEHESAVGFSFIKSVLEEPEEERV